MVGWLIGMLLLAALVKLVLDRVDVRLFAATFISANLLWLAAAFLIQSMIYLCAAAIWVAVPGLIAATAILIAALSDYAIYPPMALCGFALLWRREVSAIDDS